MTSCVISQPRFFPPLHYLHRMIETDHFVILDTVQFTPRHEENRAKLKKDGGTQWLTVPMQRKSREQRIVDTMISEDHEWRESAIKTLTHLYGKAPCFSEFMPEVEQVLRGPHTHLTELDRASWETALRLLDVDCEFHRASELPVEGKGPQLLLDLCKHLGADVYISGPDGKRYLDVEDYARNGVEVRYHDYDHPVYPQRFGEFVPFLSYLDMLFNAGLDRARVAPTS